MQQPQRAQKVRVATSSRKWWWAAGGLLTAGAYSECYARSLADLIMMECPGLGPEAPGHCAHPYWLAMVGLLLLGSGALALIWLTLRAVFRKRPPS